MKIIVDTNIVFSAILNRKSKIGVILLQTPPDIEFISPQFLLHELNVHQKKLLKITGYNEQEYEEIRNYVIQNIEFVNEDIIKANIWERSYELLKDIDENDIAFLALSITTNGTLWTGDKKLFNGLQSKNYPNLINTESLYHKYFI